MKKRVFVIAFICVTILLLQIQTDRKNHVETYSQIVRDMGYTVSDEPIEVVEFTIPEKFNDVYEKYNNMLMQNGYDLTPYKGRMCKRYTYLAEPGNVRANIIVCDGEIIGGDVSGITLDGIMIPIENNP